ncbi:MAG: nickel-dependent hydrogenase large subunit [Desulfobacteraceae bacterium]|nr:nickel-dependent hydrogenase large subunit [Desulfobacteraceae bacterium]
MKSPKSMLGSFILRKAVAPLSDRRANSTAFMDDLEITEFPIYPGSTLLNKSLNGKTLTDPEKSTAYSFIKSPRYDGKPHEAGPLARVWITNPALSKAGQAVFGTNAKVRDIGDAAFSILGRHVARAEETLVVANAVEQWLQEAKPGKETLVPAEIPKSAEGLGLSEAPRGALLHYVDIKNSVISNYQITSATIWNANPRDDKGIRGPMEEALVGVPVPDPKNPVNVGRLIRSFDP